MSRPIDLRDYAHVVDALAPGEDTRVNHEGCPAGRDEKRRLWIKRDDKDVVAAYCHHCEERAVLYPKERNYLRRKKARPKPVGEFLLPDDFSCARDDMHVLASAWFWKCRITQQEKFYYQLGWSDMLGRAVLPVFRQGNLVAYQTRRLLPKDTGPKYLTYKAAGIKHPFFVANRRGEDLILTEDILSAVKVARVAGSLALLGTHLSDEMASYITRYNPERIFVWLDDDNAQVRAAQRKIVGRLECLADTRLITGVGRDPKELTENEILDVLRRA